MSTSTPILDSFNAALAQFYSTPAGQLAGRVRWTGTPEQVQAMADEIMGYPGTTDANPAPHSDSEGEVAAAAAYPRFLSGLSSHAIKSARVFQYAGVAIHAHPLGGGFSIDAEPAKPALTHAVDASRISRVEIREHMAGLVLPPATNDVDAQARATIVHLLAEAREPNIPGEKATLVGAAAQLLAALK